ncbi:MAG: hypothetical protein ACKOFT_09680 [Actinomycetota bacterium]
MRQRVRGWRLEVWQWACVGIACGGLVSRPATATYPATSENLPLAAAYGQGVHAYFAGDYHRSYDDLSQAIVAGTQDPRAYYFRGLAALRMGRLDEAEADFSSGADREMTQSGDWRVGRSLERVQGGDRLRLERHRTRARIVALQNDREAVRRRYSEIEDAQDEVLRRRRPAAVPAEAGNPFEADAEPVEELPPMKKPPAADAAEDAKPADDEKPMADEDKPSTAEKPADEDPFGDKAPAPKPEAEASSEPAADN